MRQHFMLRPLVHVFLIGVFSLIAYSNTFHVPFLFDDRPAIVNNPIIRDLGYFAEPSKAADFRGHFEYKTFRQRYIGYLTFALNYKFHGLEVTGYHIINLLIHTGTALLLYLFIILTFRTPVLAASPVQGYRNHIAFFTALIFACHPLQTQAVTYIFQRVTGLAAFLYVASLAAYAKWRLDNPGIFDSGANSRSHRRLLFYLVSLLAAVLAMKTKENAFMIPVMTALYELIFFKGETGKRAVYFVPFLLTMLIVPSGLTEAGNTGEEVIGEIRGNTEMSRWVYLITSFRVIITYLRLVFFPVNQNLDYDYPQYGSFFDAGILLSFLALAAIAGTTAYLFFRCRKRAVHINIIAFGVCWFFVNLLLEQSIIPLNNVIFEHRMYLPSVGLFLSLVVSVFFITEKVKTKMKNIEGAATAALLVIAVALTSAAYARNAVWKDKITIWQDVARKSPAKKRAHYSLGLAYWSGGLVDRAIEEYLTALKIKPDDEKVHYDLALAYHSKGRINEAIRHYRAALEIDPYDIKAHNNLGVAYISAGLPDRAMEHYRAAVKLDPGDPDLYNNMGRIYEVKGLFDEAIAHYAAAAKIDPLQELPHMNLGRLYARKGMLREARSAYERVLQINPANQTARLNLESMLSR